MAKLENELEISNEVLGTAMNEIIRCEVCHKTLVAHEQNIYKDVPCPHCGGVASPKLEWEESKYQQEKEKQMRCQSRKFSCEHVRNCNGCPHDHSMTIIMGVEWGHSGVRKEERK